MSHPLRRTPFRRPGTQAGLVRAIGSSPDPACSLICATRLSAMGSAEVSVNITNAYFAPDPQLLRGVDVHLSLPSQTDLRRVFHAGRSYHDRQLRAGVNN